VWRAACRSPELAEYIVETANGPVAIDDDNVSDVYLKLRVSPDAKVIRDIHCGKKSGGFYVLRFTSEDDFTACWAHLSSVCSGSMVTNGADYDY